MTNMIVMAEQLRYLEIKKILHGENISKKYALLFLQ